WQLGHELSERIESLAQKEQISIFDALLGAFQTLLHRYTASVDIVVGTPVSYRTAETGNLLGYFNNRLAIRTDFSGISTFRELLTRTRRSVLEAYDGKSLPFEKLLEALDLQASASHSPLFQV